MHFKAILPIGHGGTAQLRLTMVGNSSSRLGLEIVHAKTSSLNLGSSRASEHLT